MSGLMVVINGNKILASGWCLFWFRYLVQYGMFLVAFMWLGWSIFSTSENVFAGC